MGSRYLPQPTRYTAKIIKAGALLADTKTLLSQWDSTVSVQQNLQRLQRENVFGKASRSRIQDIVAIFRQRYLLEEPVTRALVALVAGRFPAAALDRILYFHAARADRLLYDVVTEILVPMQAQGLHLIDTIEIEKVLARWVHEGKMTTRWSDPTLHRVTRGLLSTLRDFGVLQGAVNKRIAPAYLPIKAGVAWMERSLRSAIQVPPAMIIVRAIAIYRRASLPRLIAMQRRVLAETMIKAG